MQSQFPIHKRIIGVNKRPQWQIIVQDVAKEHFGLGPHRRLQSVAIIDLEVRRWRHLADVVQVQPASDKMPYESLRLGIGQQAFDLLPQDVRLCQLPSIGQLAERRIGHRRPQEIRQA